VEAKDEKAPEGKPPELIYDETDRTVSEAIYDTETDRTTNGHGWRLWCREAERERDKARSELQAVLGELEGVRETLLRELEALRADRAREKAVRGGLEGAGGKTRLSMSREEITDAVLVWLRANYPPDNTDASADKWCERCGLFLNFIHAHFPRD